ncbi:protein PTHB1 isoform X1 [Microplitis mediator]|uniref:protein PTHB1 isoform X1 n=1 Tax=Microplitis mediator TaxID=375433 RepID=UPI002555557A|nr:protein PTHB1 isoform X1 [Microplitis mediator]
MSLFRTREWWRTECGGGQEIFDGKNLLVVPLFGEDKKDIIVVSSHSGFLRLYSPSSKWDDENVNPTGYQLTDLIIESRVADCIVDVKAGKFVSGSQDLRLGILTPSKLLVYAVTFSPGSTEHGDRCILEVVYEHELPRFPASLIAGPFGGARGRDFFCVQCLDGTMLFYEQEIHTFHQVLKDRLLPEQVAYVPRNDVFITSSPGWLLECYRYQNIAEFGRLEEERKNRMEINGKASSDNGDNDNSIKWLEPDWTYNLGEAILGIQTVTLSSFEVGIIVLGERNLYCFRDNCTSVKYAKKLDYSPVCFHAYVIEPDGKLMVLVVADTDTLLVYEGATLKWSAQLPFTPVAIVRAHFQHLEGVLVILSEEGRIEACYLGAEPSLFVAPPLHSRGFDSKAAQKELMELRKLSKKASSDNMTKAVMESEITIKSTIDVTKDPQLNTDGEIKDYSSMVTSPSCKINIELSSYTIIKDVEVNLQVVKPLLVNEDFYSFPSLRDRQQISVTVNINGRETVLSSDLRLTASYETDKGDLRVIEKIIQLPLRMFVRICPPENATTFSATFKSSNPLLNFSQLFPELLVDYSQRQSSSSTSNALGLRHINSGRVVTIVLGTNTNRYRVQSNDALSMTLIIQQLLSRLSSRLNPNPTPGNIVASISQNNLQLVQGHIESHFVARQQVHQISSEIALLTTQLRNIEKRILQSMRERNSRSLTSTGLSILLESTYQLMFTQFNQLESAQMELHRAAHELYGSLRLVLLLSRTNITDDDKYGLLEAAIGFEPQPRDSIDWEEIAEVTLAALLRGTSRKSEHESSVRQVSWNEFKTTRDLAKLKKRFIHAVDRLSKPSDDNSVLQEDE